VGALATGGWAWFTNYGAHIRACAPGVDIISTFFGDLDPTGQLQGQNPNSDMGDYNGWAKWSGTSFAAPIVGAELARESAVAGEPIGRAIKRRIDDPGLVRYAELGAIINLR
jgi:subtilisin family serine protease